MWNTEQLRVFISGIEGIRTILFPDGTFPAYTLYPLLLTLPAPAPVVPDHTECLLQQVASARALHDSLHTDLVRTLFSNVREHTRCFSKEAFQQHFRSTIPDTSAHGQMNAVIHAFNHYNNPAMQCLPLPPYELSADELPPKKPATKSERPEPVSNEKEEGEAETDADGEEEDGPDEESTKLSLSAGEKRKRDGAK
jgi:hypothetical protein